MTVLEMYNQEQVLKQLNFTKLLSANTFNTDAEAKAFLADMTGIDPEKKKNAIMHLVDAVNLPTDFLHGKSLTSHNGLWGKVASQISEKSITGLTHTGPTAQIVAQFESSGSELTRDMEWMAFFDMYSITGALVAEIVDVISLVTWSEYEFNKEIQTSAYKQDSATFLTASRYGGGLAFNRLDFQRHPMVSLNMAINALRVKSVDLKISNAYTTIQAGITAADTAGQITLWNALGVAHTLNNGRNTLIQRNANKGFNLSFNQTVEVYANPQHYDILQAVMAAWYPTQSSDGTTANNAIRIVPNTINMHMSYNILNDVGQTTNKLAVAMVLRGQKNIWCDFDPLRFGQNENIKIDGLEMIGQEYYASQAATDQIQIVNLEA